MKKKGRKIIDSLVIFASLFMIVILLVVLFYSLEYWVGVYVLIESFSQKMFSIGLIISVVTVLAQWIEGRLRLILKIVNSSKGGTNVREIRKK